MRVVGVGYGKLPDVKEAFEIYWKTPHGSLERKARAKLERMGYRVISRDDAPEWIKSVGSPDIIAVRGDEYVLVEVKPSDQLKRYSKAKAKLILVTDVEEGKAIEVWGLKELE
jgi:Holliday junction resolvase-like predicted endonuclease